MEAVYTYVTLNILFSSPIHENRRKFNLKGKKPKAFHPLVLTKAENIAGYEKFTLDEVIYPDEKKEKEPEVGILMKMSIIDHQL